MCGRVVQKGLADLARSRGLTIRNLVQNYIGDRYNVPPGVPVAVIENQDGELALDAKLWGFMGTKGFQSNSRSDTLGKHEGYLMSFRRVLLPVSGFYEWPTLGGRKRSFYIHPALEAHWFFAAVMKDIEEKKGQAQGISIVTCEPTAMMMELHHRWPVALNLEGQRAWLDPTSKGKDLLSLLRPSPDEDVDACEVGAACADSRNQGPQLILPVA